MGLIYGALPGVDADKLGRRPVDDEQYMDALGPDEDRGGAALLLLGRPDLARQGTSPEPAVRRRALRQPTTGADTSAGAERWNAMTPVT
ncbi:unnamed protein product [Miscanthus lutarioriparius]|uniref:Uncharacterized protein n=1 Tax=Miscanthus lutarioriparius TaxID=422564 RepID=A0A811R182_9POAL|nr:unnamed protein product [Miscanthus lutarioriparius]